MKTVSDNDALREQVRAWRQAGERVAFVPTMGNLHEGHIALVEKAKSLASHCVVSIFVNPLQFGEGEDFESYPRTLDADQEKLEAASTDLLYSPTVETLYPGGQETQTRVEVPGISDILCGASRPGHFVGVATVVCKLFNLAQPDIAVFGEKDFQQLMVIRHMTEDLCLPIEIVGLATVREADGLAKSSRNGYLTPDERARAPVLYQVLRTIRDGVRQGEEFNDLILQGESTLRQAGFTPDYLTIRRTNDLQPADYKDKSLVIVAAAYLGKARLIDNLSFDVP